MNNICLKAESEQVRKKGNTEKVIFKDNGPEKPTNDGLLLVVNKDG